MKTTQKARWRVAALAVACACLFVRDARAVECGDGLALNLNAATAAQGTLLLAEVRSTKSLAGVEGRWTERDVPFWKVRMKSQASRADLRRAILGVDLEKPPGSYQFTIAAETAAGEHISCGTTVKVVAGRFATEKLTVKKQFVEPNPEQEARAEADSKKLREIYNHVSPERMWNGKFRVPLDGVYKGTNFGRRRVLNGHPGSPHTGVDFPSPTGTPVHASQRGRVVLAEDLYFAGNTVVVDHGLGIYTFYCHFSEIGVKVGDMVDAGDVLGKVGATGRVTGPHLHWGLDVERARVNALDIVNLSGAS